MNKLLGSILVVGLLFGAGSNALAAGPVEGCTLRHDIQISSGSATSGTVLTSSDADWGMLCLLDSVYSVTDWIFYGLLSLVSVLTVYGGFAIVTAGGDSEKVGKGRDYIVYATLGLVVAFLSKVIPSIAEGIVG